MDSIRQKIEEFKDMTVSKPKPAGGVNEVLDWYKIELDRLKDVERAIQSLIVTKRMKVMAELHALSDLQSDLQIATFRHPIVAQLAESIKIEE